MRPDRRQQPRGSSAPAGGSPLASVLCALALAAAAGVARASTCHARFPLSAYPRCAQLSPNASLHWAVAAGSITWGLDLDGEWSWVGVGLSEGGMLGADMAVASLGGGGDGGVGGSAVWGAQDMWSAGFERPVADGLQNVTLVSAEKGGGRTLIEMRRPLASCDPQDRSVLNDTRQTVVFAYGLGPFGYHGPQHRGSKQLVLLPAPLSEVDPAASGSAPELALQVLEVRMPPYAVPTAPTTYTCVNLELPSDKKYHIYKYEPLIDNARVVHHFVVWACAAKPRTALSVPYDCLPTDNDMECARFYMEWAPGSGTIVSPPEAAQAFGNGSKVYVSLQIHYTNLEGLEGQTDSSGFRVYYSNVLKKYDMGIVTLGSESITIPPGVESWSTKPNTCPGRCTQRFAPPGGVTLVDSFYHMHQVGKQMITRHIRNGTELAPLGRRDFFDFAFQGTVNIPPSTRQLLPGDELITTCTYTGVGRSETTKYGLASWDEMCYNYLSYYPENPGINYCLTLDNQSAIPGGVGVATCGKQEELVQLESEADFAMFLQAGKLVLMPRSSTFKPYRNPACRRRRLRPPPAPPRPPAPPYSPVKAFYMRIFGASGAV